MALAMAHVPASHGGVVLGIIPLATVAAAALVTHERPSLGFWLAVSPARPSSSSSWFATAAPTQSSSAIFICSARWSSGGFGYALSGRLKSCTAGR